MLCRRCTVTTEEIKPMSMNSWGRSLIRQQRSYPEQLRQIAHAHYLNSRLSGFQKDRTTKDEVEEKLAVYQVLLWPIVEQNIKNSSFQQLVNVPFQQVAETIWIHQRQKIGQKPVSNKKNDSNMHHTKEMESFAPGYQPSAEAK
ncbi:uncharacterized protein [Mytilus edulis]|uniref:uncharacterized protein n=1 Tax=Mytilus edulis TaxID=6550 RepID=UPI0039EE5134